MRLKWHLKSSHLNAIGIHQLKLDHTSKGGVIERQVRIKLVV